MEENKNNKKKILILGILLVIVTIGVLGITYAAYNFQREGDFNELIAGDIYMHYKGQNAGISIDNAVPSKTYDKEKYFEFTIDGKNTYTEKDIWYEIDLVEGDQPDGRKTRIDDKYLRFTLTEQIGSGPEKTVVNSVGYDDITNKKIWVNKIDRNTNNEITITYKLYMWISDEVHIGYDDENEIQSDYTLDEWANNIYASVKINVKGDFIEKEIDETQYWLPRGDMIDKIIEKAYSNTKEIVAINKDGDKCTDVESCNGNIREYRYIGPEVNNYIYLKDNNNSNELWRIIGIFEDETTGQYIKIVRDAVLPTEKIADYYTANGQKYKIKNSGVNAYWNRFEPHESNSGEKNNWSTAGLQYWLNEEENDAEGNENYLSYLSSDVRAKIVSVKHYLGTVSYDKRYGGSSTTITDNPKEAYANERAVACSGDKGTIESSTSFTLGNACRVWKDNATTWTGKVSLMYPSDYGYAANSKYWSTKPLGNSSYTGVGKGGYNDEEVKTNNWMMSTMEETNDKNSWLISPASTSANYATFWFTSGDVNYNNIYNDSRGVRPVLNLSSSTSIVGDGDGTKENPYKIVE